MSYRLTLHYPVDPADPQRHASEIVSCSPTQLYHTWHVAGATLVVTWTTLSVAEAIYLVRSFLAPGAWVVIESATAKSRIPPSQPQLENS